MSFSFNKVTTGTYNFVSIILNIAPDGAMIAGGLLLFPASLVLISAKIQFFVQVKIISTSQLFSGIFKFFQKLLKCFSGITTSAFINVSLFSDVFPVILVLYYRYQFLHH